MRGVWIVAVSVVLLLGYASALQICSCTRSGQVDCGERQEGYPLYQATPPNPSGCYAILQLPAGVSQLYPGWTDACNRLAICYETCHSYKANCDKAFYTDLRTACAATQGPWGSATLSKCYGDASFWANILTSTQGFNEFIGQQTSHCKCSP